MLAIEGLTYICTLYAISASPADGEKRAKYYFLKRLRIYQKEIELMSL